MTLSWSDYVTWAHESGTRKAGPDTPEHERAALFKIWSLGLGEELLEFVAEVDDWSDPLYVRRGNISVSSRRTVVLLELGDCLFYLARMYRDTGNDFDAALEFGTLASMARNISKVVGCCKKAYRAEGDRGLLRLGLSEDGFVFVHGSSEKKSGRRAEFGRLLDRSLGSIEAWLIAHGSSLSEACELNVDKLVKRRKEGLISAQGERVSELGKAVRPEDLKPACGVEGCNYTDDHAHGPAPVLVKPVHEASVMERREPCPNCGVGLGCEECQGTGYAPAKLPTPKRSG